MEALLARLDRTGLLVDDLLTLAVTDRSDLLTRPLDVADLAADLERDLPLRVLVLRSQPGEGTRAVVELPGLREPSGDRRVRPAGG